MCTFAIEITQLAMKSNAAHIYYTLFFILALTMFSSCSTWHEAKTVIVEADSLDQNEHILYSDTTALRQAITTWDNPMGRLLYANQLGKAYYYLGRNLSNEGAIAEAATLYIEADRLQISDPLYRGRINSCMAHIAKQNESDSLALIFFERANHAFQTCGKDWYYAYTLLDVSEFNTNLHYFAKADSVLKIAESYALDDAYVARTLETRGLYYYALQEYDSALVYFKRGLDYWTYDEDKVYTYMKMMQVCMDMDDLSQAVIYAQFIVDHSDSPTYLINAYYPLMLHARAQNNTELLGKCAHARADAQSALRTDLGGYVEALKSLREYVANPYPLRWVGILVGCVGVGCILLIISVLIYRKRTAKLLQVARQKIEEKENAYTEEKRVYDFNTALADIRAKYSHPRKQWNDYNELRKDLNTLLYDWLRKLETLGLSNRENVFCVYMIVYPYASLDELADWMHYSPTGISTFKRRIAQKLGISTRELYDFLHNTLVKAEK